MISPCQNLAITSFPVHIEYKISPNRRDKNEGAFDEVTKSKVENITKRIAKSNDSNSNSSKVLKLEKKLQRLQEKLHKIEQNSNKKMKKLGKRLEYAQKKQDEFREKNKKISSQGNKNEQRLSANSQKIHSLKKKNQTMVKKLDKSAHVSKSITSNNEKFIEKQRSTINRFSIIQQKVVETISFNGDLQEERDYLERLADTKVEEINSVRAKINLQATIRESLEFTLVDVILPITKNCRSVKLQKDALKIAIRCQDGADDALNEIVENYGDIFQS